MAVQGLARVPQAAARAPELLGAIPERLFEPSARLLESRVGAGELLRARLVFPDQARALEGNRYLVREGAQRRQLALEVRAALEPGLEVKRADRVAVRREDRHARDGL